MALGEQLIDLVSGFLRWPGGGPGRSGDLNLGLCHDFSCLHPPADQTSGLAGQIIQCRLKGLEPAAEARGVDQAIGWMAAERGGYGPGRRPNGHQSWSV